MFTQSLDPDVEFFQKKKDFQKFIMSYLIIKSLNLALKLLAINKNVPTMYIKVYTHVFEVSIA